LLRVAGRVIVAAPVIIEAVKPVLRKRKVRRSKGTAASVALAWTKPEDARAVEHRHGT
jgi:hypothetical protein